MSGAVTKAVKASSQRERWRERAKAALVPATQVKSATIRATLTLFRRAAITSGSPNAWRYQRRLNPANGRAVVEAALKEKRSITTTGAKRKTMMTATMTHQMALERSMAWFRGVAANSGCRDVRGEPSPKLVSSPNSAAMDAGIELALPEAVSFIAPHG